MLGLSTLYLSIDLQPQLVKAAGGDGSVPRRVEVLGHAAHAQRPQCARDRREGATARCEPAEHRDVCEDVSAGPRARAYTGGSAGASALGGESR